MSEIIEYEWPHLVEADEVTKEPVKMSIRPEAEHIKNLERRLGVLRIKSIVADLVLQREQGGMVVTVTGDIKAEVEQACVVTLAPVVDNVGETFKAWYADADQAIPLAKAKHDKMAKAGGGEIPILHEQDDPEPIIEGQIDLGELVVQHLSLAINPYPHAEGVAYEYGDDEPQKVPDAFKTNPFAALKDWKHKLDD